MVAFAWRFEFVTTNPLVADSIRSEDFADQDDFAFIPEPREPP